MWLNFLSVAVPPETLRHPTMLPELSLSLQFDYATNVPTFDYTQEPVNCADLVLCAPAVEREAKEHGKSLPAHYAHLIVHGTLHGQGWDYELSEEDAQAMKARKSVVLMHPGFADSNAS